MATKKSDDAKVKAFLDKAQAREDRYRAQRLTAIKRAIAGAEFYDGELDAMEQTVFLAYGRTKLLRR